jgi:hypothetical protein
VSAILWDYQSGYYSWRILASAGGYVFASDGPENVGVATGGAIKGLSEIISLVKAGVLPKERLIQRFRRPDGARQSRNVDLRAIGMVKPDKDRDRFRVGTHSRHRRKCGASLRWGDGGLPQSVEPQSRFS